MPVDDLIAILAVSDYDTALNWYGRLFGRPPDLVETDDEARWQLRDGAWVAVVADPSRAGNGLVRVLVDDLASQVVELAERGIAVGTIESSPGRVRRTVVADQEGNLITFCEDLDDGL